MATIDTIDYTIGDELESLQLWWTANGTLVDLSVTTTYTSKLYLASDSARTALFTKTTGFTGAAGSGTKTSGTPNLTVAWATSGELNVPTVAGLYVFSIRATRSSDSRVRTARVNFNLSVY